MIYKIYDYFSYLLCNESVAESDQMELYDYPSGRKHR